MTRPFHLALPTKDLKSTEAFYVDKLNCKIGRRDTTWIDFDLYGHQLVFHQTGITLLSAINPVDRKSVSVPHFGVILSMSEWKLLSERLTQTDMNFLIEPYVRFEDTPGEQATMFFEDNNGYAVEMKAFKTDEMIFAPFEEADFSK